MLAGMRWQVIVPLKPAVYGKTRLGLGAELARAIALDTIAAAVAASSVERVLVVTADDELARSVAGARVSVVREVAPSGISSAIAAALRELPVDVPRAVMLGDLPALRPSDLDAALDAAVEFERTFVPDREGTGSVLVTVAAGLQLIDGFGDGSAARHEALGLTRIDLPETSTLRRDVDTPEQLAEARNLGLGPATAALA